MAAMCAVLAVVVPPQLQAQGAVPKYDVDATWPKPMPNRWVISQIGAVCVDAGDHVFMLNRQTLTDNELDAGVVAPPVIEFDSQGNVVNSWGDPKQLPRPLHGCTVDKDNNVWIVSEGSGMAQKYSHDGKLLAQLGKPDIRLAGVAVDPKNGDAYFAAGGQNPGIVVFDKNGQFLRQWPLHRTESEKNIAHVLHCIGMTNDGLVYVCDRRAFRLQVFDQMGNFKKNIDVQWKQYTPHDGKRKTGEWGSASNLAFSRDASQKFLFVTNEDNAQIDIVDRDSGKVLSSFGRGAGHFPGQFTHAHGVAVDSKGNVYVGETDEGKRVQKFKIVGQ
jgi:uncharacterized protein YjiK